MRCICLVLLLLTLCAGCRHSPISAEGSVGLRFIGTFKADASANYDPTPSLLFELHNDTQNPIWFDGFHLTRPLYEIDRVDGTEREQVGSSMSATGATLVPLTAGQSTAFIIPRYFGEGGQFEFKLWIGTTDKPDFHELVSPKFDLSPLGP